MRKGGRKSLVPKLRFPEFREDGEWEIEPLSKVGENLDSKRVPITEKERVKGEIPYYGASGIIDYVKDYIFDEELLCISEDGANLVARSYPIAFSISGKTWVNNHAHVLKFKSSYTQVIVENYLNSINIEDFLTGMAQPKLNRAKLDIIPIPLPEPAEQQKIASCLSSLDELITTATQKLESLKSHKKGLMQKLFPVEGETVPKLRFPEFREDGEWSSGELGKITIKVGSGITPKGGEKTYQEEGRPFVRSQNIGWGVLILEDVAHIDDETHSTFSATEIEKGDVLLNISGASIGRSAVASECIVGGNVNQHVCIIRTKSKELNSFYLNQFLLSNVGQSQIDSFQAGGNRQGLNFGQIRTFDIPLPPNFKEQQKIASCLSSLDDLITGQTQKLEALKSHKKGLMQQLFPSIDEEDE